MTWPLPPLWDASILELVRWSQHLASLRATLLADKLLTQGKQWLLTTEAREGLSDRLNWTNTEFSLSWRDGGPAVDIKAHWSAPMPDSGGLSMHLDTEGVFMDGLDVGDKDILRRVGEAYPWDKLTAKTPLTAMDKVNKTWPRVEHPVVTLGQEPSRLLDETITWRQNVLAMWGHRVLSSLPAGTKMCLSGNAASVSGSVPHKLRRGYLHIHPSLTKEQRDPLVLWANQMMSALAESSDPSNTWSRVGRWLTPNGPLIWSRDDMPAWTDILPPTLRMAYEATRLDEALPAATISAGRAPRL